MSHQTSRPRIVVVDDDVAVLRTVKRQLHALGWEAFPVQNAAEALTRLGNLGRVDAVLTDVNMPYMDGLTLRHEVRQRFPGTAVVLMSGDIEPAAGVFGRDDIILRKPFSLQALAAVLDAVRTREE